MASGTITNVDLSRLDPPTLIEQVDYETILARMVARVQQLLPSFDATVDSDPAVKVLQVAAYDEMLLRQDFNERLTQRLIAYAKLHKKRMFARLRLARYLRAGANADEAWVGFSGNAARIASVHQEGGMDAPAPGVRKVRYARRILMGLSDAELSRVINAVLDGITKRHSRASLNAKIP